MAQRRMFSPEIVGSDAFIDMPVSARELYFQLGMKADDDGFVNPQVTMRTIGATGDDLKVLLLKRFVLPFENGVIVIKHWRINNFIRKDRYKETRYLDEKNLLYVKNNDSFTFDKEKGEHISKKAWKSDEDKRLTNGQPNDIPLVNAGKDRLGKDRLYNRDELNKKYKQLVDKVG